jgi:hypothetical protein
MNLAVISLNNRQSVVLSMSSYVQLMYHSLKSWRQSKSNTHTNENILDVSMLVNKKEKGESSVSDFAIYLFALSTPLVVVVVLPVVICSLQREERRAEKEENEEI